MCYKNKSDDCIYIQAEIVLPNSPVTPTKRIAKTTYSTQWSVASLEIFASLSTRKGTEAGFTFILIIRIIRNGQRRQLNPLVLPPSALYCQSGSCEVRQGSRCPKHERE
eukprot:8541174-Pyramimonas_sp.AAC.2